MSYKFQDSVWGIVDVLDPSAKFVLMAIAFRANEDGECWPSATDIQKITGLNVKTVRRCLASLESLGYLVRTRRDGKSDILKIVDPALNRVDTLPKNDHTQNRVYPKTDLDPTQNRVDTLPKIGQRTNKEQVIEQVIVKETNKESFEDFDAPLSEQIENAQLEHCENVLDDPEHVLNAVEMVVLAKTLGVRLTNNAGLQEIANRKTLTVDLFRKSVEKWVSTGTGTGYLIGILKNASLNPDCVNPKKAEPKELTVDTITDKQAGFFASKLVRDTGFCCRFGKGQSDFGVFASKVAANLRNPRHFDEYKPYLLKLGLMNNGASNEIH